MQISRLNGTLFPKEKESKNRKETREDHVKRIKKLVRDDSYVTHEKLNKTLEKMLEEIDRD